jgi:Gram-negative bacterial TonB protein C-terminal
MHPTRTLCSCLLALASAVSAQTPAPATAPPPPQPSSSLPADPAALLQLAAQVNGLHGSDLKPWHIRATWQTLDQKKHVKTQGTWEEWWAGSKEYKIIASSTKGQVTVYATNKGRFLVQAPGKEPDTDVLPEPGTVPGAYFSAAPGGLIGAEFLLERLLTYPVPEITSDGLRHMRLQEAQEGGGNVSMKCVLQAFILPDGGPHVSIDKDGKFRPSINRYCFDPDAPVLRIESSPGDVILFNSMIRFQDHYLARAIRIESTGVWTSTNDSRDSDLSQATRGYSPVEDTNISIDAVEPLTAVVNADFSPPAGAVPLPEISDAAVTLGVMSGGQIAGKDPDISEAAEWHLSGKVLVTGKILKDGSVGDLRVVGGSRSLQRIFMDAVKTWRFEPYLVGGEPVDVEMGFMLNVNLND